MAEEIKKSNTRPRLNPLGLAEMVVRFVFGILHHTLGALDAFLNIRLRDKVKFVWTKRKMAMIFVAIGIFALPFITNAQDDVTPWLDSILWYVVKTGIYFTGWILPIMMGLLESALKFNQTIFANFPTFGWELVRDTANMFFILVLLAVAFATVLQIESWNFKTVLPRFVAAVLLVNFSLILTQTAITVGNFLFSGILNAGGGAVGTANLLANIYNLEMITGIQDEVSIQTKDPAIISAVFTLAALLIGLSVLFRLTLTFFVRVVALWLLAIVSPFALLAYTIPSTKSYAEKWAQELLKYIFLGPIAAFFYVLAIRIGVQKPTGTATKGTIEIFSFVSVSTFLTPQNLISYIIVLIFLWFAGSIAKKGAGVVGEAVYKAGSKWGGKALSFGAGAVVGGSLGFAKRRIDRKAADPTSSGIWRKTSSALNVVPYLRGKKAATPDQQKAFDRLGESFGFDGFGGFVSGQRESERRATQDRQLNERSTADHGANLINYTFKDALEKLLLAYKTNDRTGIESNLMAITKKGDAFRLENEARDKKTPGGIELDKLGLGLDPNDPNQNFQTLVRKTGEKGYLQPKRANEIGRYVQQESKVHGDIDLYAEFDEQTGERYANDEQKQARMGEIAENATPAQGAKINLDRLQNVDATTKKRTWKTGSGAQADFAQKVYSTLNDAHTFNNRNQDNSRKKVLDHAAQAEGFKDANEATNTDALLKAVKRAEAKVYDLVSRGASNDELKKAQNEFTDSQARARSGKAYTTIGGVEFEKNGFKQRGN